MPEGDRQAGRAEKTVLVGFVPEALDTVVGEMLGVLQVHHATTVAANADESGPHSMEK